MNLAETNDLLTLIAGYDNRRFGDETVYNWQRIFPDLGFDDCQAAVVEHFATSDAYLMPVHVRRGALARVRNRHQLEREAHEALAIDAERSDPTRGCRSGDVTDIINRLRTMLPDGHPDKLRRPEWLNWERNQDRQRRAEQEPNTDFVGFPPPGGHNPNTAGRNA